MKLEESALISIFQSCFIQAQVLGYIKVFKTKKNNLEYAIDRTYTGDFKMPQFVIQNIEQKLRFHQFYIDQTIFELKRNAVIEKLIKKEIATKE